MALFLSTVSGDVTIEELGYIIPHPTVNFEITAQFSEEDIRNADSIASLISSGLLLYRLSPVEPYRNENSYDKDIALAESLVNNGTSSQIFSPVVTPPNLIDFVFNGSLSVKSDSSFQAGIRGVKVTQSFDHLMEVIGSVTVKENGQLVANNGSSIKVRSL